MPFPVGAARQNNGVGALLVVTVDGQRQLWIAATIAPHSRVVVELHPESADGGLDALKLEEGDGSVVLANEFVRFELPENNGAPPIAAMNWRVEKQGLKLAPPAGWVNTN